MKIIGTLTYIINVATASYYGNNPYENVSYSGPGPKRYFRPRRNFNLLTGSTKAGSPNGFGKSLSNGLNRLRNLPELERSNGLSRSNRSKILGELNAGMLKKQTKSTPRQQLYFENLKNRATRNLNGSNTLEKTVTNLNIPEKLKEEFLANQENGDPKNRYSQKMTNAKEEEKEKEKRNPYGNKYPLKDYNDFSMKEIERERENFKNFKKEELRNKIEKDLDLKKEEAKLFDIDFNEDNLMGQENESLGGTYNRFDNIMDFQDENEESSDDNDGNIPFGGRMLSKFAQIMNKLPYVIDSTTPVTLSFVQFVNKLKNLFDIYKDESVYKLLVVLKRILLNEEIDNMRLLVNEIVSGDMVMILGNFYHSLRKINLKTKLGNLKKSFEEDSLNMNFNGDNDSFDLLLKLMANFYVRAHFALKTENTYLDKSCCKFVYAFVKKYMENKHIVGKREEELYGSVYVAKNTRIPH